MEMTGQAFLSRKERKEIKEDVVESLKEDMPALITSIEVLHRIGTDTVYVGTASEKAADNVMILLQNLGLPSMMAMEPFNRGSIISQENIKEYYDMPVDFTQYVNTDVTPGIDFLTWLWYAVSDPSSGYGGTFELEDNTLAAAICDSITLVKDDNKITLTGATVAATRGAMYALKNGYKPVKYKLKLAWMEGMYWELSIDGDKMTYSSVKLPDGNELDPIEVFCERLGNIELLEVFINNLYYLYLQSFKTDREETINNVSDWINEADLDEYL
jgi:hypothetical protein